MKTGSITYNGKNSLELGVYTTGSGSFDAAELDVDKYEVAGRNGDVIIPKNRYKNIEVIYPAFIPKQFGDKVQSVRNWLRSAKVYSRLEETYDMDHFRLGIPSGVQSFEPVNRNDGANFEMTFDCKPQRFLKVGETPETVEADVQTESGEIVTFETIAESPMASAEVSLSPIQDLNGYDSPWPAGGGKNLTDYSTPYVAPVNISTTVNIFTLELIAGETYTYSCLQSASLASSTRNSIAVRTPGGSNIYEYGMPNFNPTNLRHTLTFTPSSDGVYTFMYWGHTLSSSITLTQWQVEKSSSFTSYAPYSNICPISGHSGAELYRTGNPQVWDEEWEVGSINDATGEDATSSARIRSKNYISVLPSTRYYIKMPTGISMRLFRYTSSKTLIDYVDISNIAITTPSNCAYLRFRTFNAYGATYNNDISINYPATDAEYHAYEGSTYSVTFGQTVYGGTLDFVSGKLVIDRVVITPTSEWSISYQGSGNTAYVRINSTSSSNNRWQDIVCSHFLKGNIYSGGTNQGVGCYGSQVYVRESALFSSKEDFTTWLDAQNTAGTPLQISYKLATPIEYTLSPQQIETLLGENNVWSDAGPITLTYAEPYNVENPTQFEARPLFIITNPEQGDVLSVRGVSITFVESYTGTVTIDCETMDCYAGFSNMNYLITATDFPVLVPGTNIVTWTGAGECTMTPRWWEL